MIQPDDGIEPILDALRSAKKSIHILIFRYDRTEIERALLEAVQRGVSVTALIAFTNRGEEKNLRKLESRLLEQGVTVARTADDLVRYHGKIFIVDRKELYVLAFNYTHLDITLSRSFAAVVTKPDVVAEAVRLFEADAKRAPFHSEVHELVVSPTNARKELTDFINGAKKQLFLYEMKISDPDFLKLLAKKVEQGVDVRVIGRTGGKTHSLQTRKLAIRLHARAILRDGKSAFLGSQSLRKLELEARREIGVIFHDAHIVRKMVDVFEKDWAAAGPMQPDVVSGNMEIPIRRVAKLVAHHIHMKPIMDDMLERVMDLASNSSSPIAAEEVAQTVREAFREELHEAVTRGFREFAQQMAGAGAADDDDE